MKTKIVSIIATPFVISLSSTAQSLNQYSEEKRALSGEQLKKEVNLRKVQAEKLSKTQDELSADLQELIEDQTDDEMVVLLTEVEELMANVTENLEGHETGLDTLHHENVIIEKLNDALFN